MGSRESTLIISVYVLKYIHKWKKKKTQMWQLPHPGSAMANEPGNLRITAQLVDNSREVRSLSSHSLHPPGSLSCLVQTAWLVAAWWLVWASSMQLSLSDSDKSLLVIYAWGKRVLEQIGSFCDFLKLFCLFLSFWNFSDGMNTSHYSILFLYLSFNTLYFKKIPPRWNDLISEKTQTQQLSWAWIPKTLHPFQ